MLDQAKHLEKLSTCDAKLMTIQDNLEKVPLRIAELQEEIAKEQRVLDEKTARKEEMQKKRRDLERELSDIETKISSDKEKEMKVRTNEELHALQRGVLMANEKKDDIEEQILLLMEETTEFEKEVARAEKRFKDFEGKTKDEISSLEKLMEGVESQIATLTAERDEVLAKLDNEVMLRYNNLHKRSIPSPVAQVMDGVCLGCHSRIQPQTYNLILAGDKIYHCNHCGRLLVHLEEEEAAPSDG